MRWDDGFLLKGAALFHSPTTESSSNICATFVQTTELGIPRCQGILHIDLAYYETTQIIPLRQQQCLRPHNKMTSHWLIQSVPHR